MRRSRGARPAVVRRCFFPAFVGLTVVCWGAVAGPLDEAKKLQQRGNYEEALEKYRKSQAPPKEVALGSSRSLRSIGKYAEAKAELEKGLAGSPGDVDATAELADLEFFLGRWDEIGRAHV